MLLRSMVGAITSLAALSMQGAAPSQLERVVWRHELTEALAGSVNRGGRHGPDGWTLVAPRGFLRIELPGPAPRDGAVVVRIRGVDWAQLAREVGPDKKIHLLNAFSNPAGDHHVEGGGTPSDALWTLRTGTDEQGGARYGPHLKVLWASRGAKRAPGSDYHERLLPFPEGATWTEEQWIEFRVEWRATTGQLRIVVAGREAIVVPWQGRGDPLRYLFLGGATDFAGFSGATFRQLEVLQLASGHGP